MQTTTIMAVAVPIAAAAIGLAAPAHAEAGYQFISPNGNIACSMSQDSDGDGYVACEIRDYVFSTAACPSGSVGDRFVLAQGQPAGVQCRSESMVDPSLPTLSFDQPRNVGLIDCQVLPGNSVECTDRASDHYFRISSSAYEAG
jgi:hypothetical protein